MKLKYYLRGLGIGIIVTTILLMIAFALHKPTMSDADIIARAKQLGMVMPEDEEPLQDTETTESTKFTSPRPRPNCCATTCNEAECSCTTVDRDDRCAAGTCSSGVSFPRNSGT